jgi:hypothetical protein
VPPPVFLCRLPYSQNSSFRSDRLVWTEPDAGMTTTITFAELADGRIEVVTHQANVPAVYRSPGAQQGFRTSLDRCAAYVASLTRKV